MTNMCILLSALLATFAVMTAWIVGYFLLLADKDSSASQSAVAPPLDWTNPNPKVTSLLREAVRFAEERMKAQENGTQILQGKATLLGTLCVFMVGFLFSEDFASSVPRFLMPFAIGFLILSVVFCARSINFAKYGQMGMHPYTLVDILKDPDDRSEVDIFYGVFAQYYERIDQNEQSNRNKMQNLRHARWLWVAGTGFALGMMAGEGAQFFCTCNWLAMWPTSTCA